MTALAATPRSARPPKPSPMCSRSAPSRPHPRRPDAFKVADVAKLLGPSRTQTDDAVVGEAALIDAPRHEGGQVPARARTVLACSSSQAS